MDYRGSSGGLEFQPNPMHLDNTSAYSSHLQRSIDNLRNLGDRLGDRNVDLRLNLHHNDFRHDRGFNANQNPLNLDRSAFAPSAADRNHLELNLSLERNGLQIDRGGLQLQVERGGGLPLDRNGGLGNLPLDRNERGFLPSPGRYAAQQERSNLNFNGGANFGSDRTVDNAGGRNQMSDEDKYREYKDYKFHLDGVLRGGGGGGGSLEGGGGGASRQQLEGKASEDGRGTPSSPATPLSVGDGFPEEKVNITFFSL